MDALLINAYGEDAIFAAAEVEKLEVQAGHVLVKIAASSVNTVDTMIRKMGKDLPLSPEAKILAPRLGYRTGAIPLLILCSGGNLNPACRAPRTF